MLSPLRSAIRSACGLMRSAGWVPAEVLGTSLASRHRASARTERAELCVHTKTTREAVISVGLREQAVERTRDKTHVGTPLVVLRMPARDDAGGLERLQVVCEQVARDPECLGESIRGHVPHLQQVDDGQSVRVPESTQDPRSISHVERRRSSISFSIHCLNDR